MTVLTVTNAGMAAETDALTAGKPLPKIKSLVVGSGAPPTDLTAAVHLTQQFYASNILVTERLSAGAVKLYGEVPPNQIGNITELGILLEDGTLYAYAAYQPGSGGLYKAAGFAFSFYVILSRQTLPDLTFTYTPIDIPTLTTQITQDAQASIDVYLQSYLLEMVLAISGLNRNVLMLTDRVIQLERKAGLLPKYVHW